MTNTLSVENQLLLSCARSDLSAAAQAAVKDLLQQDVDWDALLASARRQSLLPLLYDRLREVDGSQVPPAVLAHLKSAYYTNLLRNQRLGAELAEVVAALRSNAIETIVLKGGALAHTVYANPAQRPMTDLDLLVRPEHVDRASAVIESLGFRLSGSVPTHVVPFHQRLGVGVEWLRTHGDQTTRLDLHHHPVGVDWCRGAFPVDVGALWQAAHLLILKGIQTLQLSPEDTLIHLCLHPALPDGYTHPLRACVDIDRVVTTHGSTLSWQRLLERAGRFRVRTALYYALQGTHRLLGTPVPPEALSALRPGHLRLRILRLLAPLDPGSVLAKGRRQLLGAKQVLLYAAIADHPGAAVRMVLDLLFPGREWLVLRYAMETPGQTQRYRLVHTRRLAQAFLDGIHRPMSELSLYGTQGSSESPLGVEPIIPRMGGTPTEHTK